MYHIVHRLRGSFICFGISGQASFSGIAKFGF